MPDQQRAVNVGVILNFRAMDDDNNHLLIIARGLHIGLTLTGLGLLLKWVIPAFRPVTVVPAMSVGIAIGSVGIGITVFAKVVVEAKKTRTNGQYFKQRNSNQATR